MNSKNTSDDIESARLILASNGARIINIVFGLKLENDDLQDLQLDKQVKHYTITN